MSRLGCVLRVVGALGCGTGCGRGSLTAAATSISTLTSTSDVTSTSTGQQGGPRQMHSNSLAIRSDRSELYVVHPDADALTVLDLKARTVVKQILLAPALPAATPAGRYEPAVSPRALALDGAGDRAFVTGQRSGHVYVVDPKSGTVQADTFVCSEPIGVLLSQDDTSVFVACSQDDEIVQLRAVDLSIVAAAPCPRKPWGLAWAADGETLVATHLLGPGVSAFATRPLALQETWIVADGAPQGEPADPTEPHGQVRGLYDVALRPGSSELWVAHLMLGTDTPQPALDFQRTVFPALSVLDAHGTQRARLSVQTNPGDGQALGDVVSGPHSIAFSDDGALAFVVDSDSEDVLVIDTVARVEAGLVRPLPGHLPEGIVYAEGEIYVSERNTEDIAAFRVTGRGSAVSVSDDGAAFSSLDIDPMPATLRLGQRLFYSANSDDLPLTQNHWVACATCHLEGRSDAVTWLFAQGPRDTPSNSGGLLDTGFLFRTADRTQVQDYWRTINVEQGGHFNVAQDSQKPLLNALAAYVNYAIPTPVPPSTDAAHALSRPALTALRERGHEVFAQGGCLRCHGGPAKTDSGSRNRTLDLRGPVVAHSTRGGVLLHDVGTCVTAGPFPDVAHTDMLGDPRDACAFDTPALRGLVDSAPYLHDGSAATLDAVVTVMLQASAGGNAPPALSGSDRQALVEYLRSL